MTFFIDTSALYALLDQEEERHEAARTTFATALDNRDVLIAHNYVVTEAAALAQRRLGAQAAVDLVGRLVPLLELVWVNRDIHDAAVAAFMASPSRSISLVDRVSFEVMRLHRIDVAFTFDADFVRAGFRAVP